MPHVSDPKLSCKMHATHKTLQIRWDLGVVSSDSGGGIVFVFRHKPRWRRRANCWLTVSYWGSGRHNHRAAVHILTKLNCWRTLPLPLATSLVLFTFILRDLQIPESIELLLDPNPKFKYSKRVSEVTKALQLCSANKMWTFLKQGHMTSCKGSLTSLSLSLVFLKCWCHFSTRKTSGNARLLDNNRTWQHWKLVCPASQALLQSNVGSFVFSNHHAGKCLGWTRHWIKGKMEKMDIALFPLIICKIAIFEMLSGVLDKVVAWHCQDEFHRDSRLQEHKFQPVQLYRHRFCASLHPQLSDPLEAVSDRSERMMDLQDWSNLIPFFDPINVTKKADHHRMMRVVAPLVPIEHGGYGLAQTFAQSLGANLKDLIWHWFEQTYYVSTVHSPLYF